MKGGRRTVRTRDDNVNLVRIEIVQGYIGAGRWGLLCQIVAKLDKCTLEETTCT